MTASRLNLVCFQDMVKTNAEMEVMVATVEMAQLASLGGQRHQTNLSFSTVILNSLPDQLEAI